MIFVSLMTEREEKKKHQKAYPCSRSKENLPRYWEITELHIDNQGISQKKKVQ